MKRDDLIKALSESDATQLAVLAQARENAKRAVLDKASKSNLDAMQTAERMLAEFEVKHGLDSGGGLSFKNLLDVHKYLIAEGYKIAQSTVYADKGLLPKRKGKISLRTVRAYIAAKRLEKQNASPAQEADAGASLGPTARRLDADVALKEKRGRLLDIELAKSERALFPAEIAERELAARAQAFRLGLEGWASKIGESVAALFGADPEQAARMVMLAGGDPTKASDLVAHQLSRVPAFVSLFVDELSKALNDYATGAWLTQEMSDRMREWAYFRELAEQNACREACQLVGADEALAGALAGAFVVSRRAVR
jgi:hypothetical protein